MLYPDIPEEYEGGELIIEDTYGTHSGKLPAGHVVFIRQPAFIKYAGHKRLAHLIVLLDSEHDPR